MKLTDEQIAMVKKWAEEGEGLSGIQARLKSECGVSLTYLDTRLCVDDLGIELEEWKAKPKEEEPKADEKSPEKILEEAKQAAESGGFSVTVDKITRPGAVVSGQVVFSDGEKSGWLLDRSGRLALDPTTPGYQPRQDDVQKFQVALDKELQKMGM